MIPGFSGEMIFIFVLALILFGPKKLPEIGRQIGRLMNEFRRASNEFRSQIESEINVADYGMKPQILPPTQAPLGSLASRIFNPPPAEQLKAAETQAAESEAETSALKIETTPSPTASSAPSKVAPDA